MYTTALLSPGDNDDDDEESASGVRRGGGVTNPFEKAGPVSDVFFVGHPELTPDPDPPPSLALVLALYDTFPWLTNSSAACLVSNFLYLAPGNPITSLEHSALHLRRKTPNTGEKKDQVN